MKKLHLKLLAGDRQFVASRGFSVFLALGFALLYSKHLGVERKGLLTFVMTSNLVFSILLISGVSLHLRNLARKDESNEFLGNYLAIVFICSLITPIFNIVILDVYEEIFKGNIPNNLQYMTAIYCFFSTLSFGIHDALLLIKSVKVASIMDVGVIILQILNYLTLVYVGETSYFVSVLISISVSYLVMVFASLLLIIYIYNPTIKISREAFVKLFKDSTSPLLTSITSQLLERIDKVFLGYLTTSGELGRYSTNQSILGLARFLPDSLAKLSITRDKNFLLNRRRLALLMMFSIPGCLIPAWAVSVLVDAVLGREWVLPITILAGLAFTELLRGMHALLSMNAIRSSDYKSLRSTSYIQLIIGILVQPFTIYFMGIAGSLLCGILMLSYGLFRLRKYVHV